MCAFGLTWQSTCDADCGGYTCPQTPGVCQYKANSASGQLVTPQGRAKPGGETGWWLPAIAEPTKCNSHIVRPLLPRSTCFTNTRRPFLLTAESLLPLLHCVSGEDMGLCSCSAAKASFPMSDLTICRNDSLHSCALCAGVQAAARNGGYPSKTSAHYSYTNALHKSLIFVETMRSGVLPRWRVAWCGATCA